MGLGGTYTIVGITTCYTPSLSPFHLQSHGITANKPRKCSRLSVSDILLHSMRRVPPPLGHECTSYPTTTTGASLMTKSDSGHLAFYVSIWPTEWPASILYLPSTHRCRAVRTTDGASVLIVGSLAMIASRITIHGDACLSCCILPKVPYLPT